MSSQNKNMAQKFLTQVIEHYSIIPPTLQNATSTPLLQDGLDIPEGIPALVAFSKLYGNSHSPDKTITKAVLARHLGSLSEIRLLAVACGLLYLSRPIIGPMLKSVWEELNQDMQEWIVDHVLPEHKTKAKPLLEPKPEPETVSVTVEELQELHALADRVQVRLDKAKRIQEDLLTENCDLADDVDRLTKQVTDDAAHADARIRGLENQIEIEKEGKDSVWKERERFRHGGKELKDDLDKLQADFNVLEDDHDDCKEAAEGLQGRLDSMATTRDNLQSQVDQLETEKQGLERSAAETAKALSDAAATKQAQEKRLEELEAQKNKEVADAKNALTTLQAQIAEKESKDLGHKMRAAVEQEKRERELKDLRTAYEMLNIDVEALRSAANDHEEIVEEYQDACEGLEQEVTQQKNELRVAEGEMAGLRAEIAALKDRLESQSTEVHDTSDEEEQSGATDGDRQDEDEGDASNDDAGKASQSGYDGDDAADDAADKGSNNGEDKVPDGADDNGAQRSDGATNAQSSPDEGSGSPSPIPSAGGQSEPQPPQISPSTVPSGPSQAQGPSPSTALSPPAESTQAAVSSPPKTPTALNAMASVFKPSTSPNLTVPPILPTHQAYFASLVGTPGPSVVTPAQSPINSVQEPGEPLPTHSPAPKAAGPGKAKNAHVRKLNEDTMKKAWRRKSGMPDTDEEIILAPEDEFEIEGMFQRQIIQAYTPMLAFSSFPPSYIDIINAPEMTSAHRATSASEAGEFSQEGGEGEGEEAHASRQDHIADACPEDCTNQADPNFEHEEVHPSSSEPAPLPHRRRATISQQPAEDKPIGRSGSAPASRCQSQESSTSVIAGNENSESSSPIEEQQANPAGISAPTSEAPLAEDVHASRSGQSQSSESPRGRAAARETSVSISSEADSNPDANEEMSQAHEDNLNTGASKKSGNPIDAPKNAATQQTSAPDSSEDPEAADESGIDGEWSDVEDEDHEEEAEDGDDDDDGMPMLGNYKVTRPKPSEDDSGEPMLGNHKVTRAPTNDDEDDGMPMLGNYKVTRPKTSEGDSGEPMPGNFKVTRGEATTGSDFGMPEAGEESADDGGRAFGDKEDGEEEKNEEDEQQKEKEKGEDTPTPSAPGAADTPSPAAQGDTNATRPNPDPAHAGQRTNRRPSNYFPGMENATKTHDEHVGDALAHFLREYGTKSLSESMWADKPDAETQAAIPQQASSLPAEDAAAPAGTAGGNDTSSPRGSANTPANEPGATPTTPAAGNGNRGSGFNVRGRGGGRAGRGGRGGRGTPSPRAGPARGSRSSNAANESFQRWREIMARAAADEAREKRG